MRKGYIFSLVTLLFIVIVMSLILFYIDVTTVTMSDVASNIQTDEIHYFVESVRSDFRRAAAISGERAGVYAVDYILRTNGTLDNYTMVDCVGIHHPESGAEAAITELSVCGTFDGSSGDSAAYMEGNTLLNWTYRITAKGRSLGYRANVTLRGIQIMPYDSWHYAVIGSLDIIVYDKLNHSIYHGIGVPAIALSSITVMEDPLFYLKTLEPAVLRYFTPCTVPGVVNGTVIDSWVDEECYHESSEGASFFDRLEGRTLLSEKYVNQSEQLAGFLKIPAPNIGLESFVNQDKFADYNIPVNVTNSWVDYMFFNNMPGYCGSHTEIHPDFRLDVEHGIKYKLVDFVCEVKIFFDGMVDTFTPATMTVPEDTNVTWRNANTNFDHLLYVDAPGWAGIKNITPGGETSWLFDTAGLYQGFCVLHGERGFVNVF